MRCVVNTLCGREDEADIIPAKKVKNVLIAGGGPGGMQASIMAKLRGHEVVLYEKINKLGGQLNVASKGPGKQEFDNLIWYFAAQIKKLGIKVETGKKVTQALVSKLKPDTVIVATGATPEIPDIPGVRSDNVIIANDLLIAQGAQPEELFILSLEKMEEQTVFIPDVEAELVENDLVIVGGGPAGLTAAIYAVRSGLNTAVVERDTLGGQVATTPLVENYPGFTQVGGKALVDLLVSHALEYVTIFQGEEVMDIQPDGGLTVLTSRRRFKTKAVLLATGATHKHLGVPGESRFSGRGVTYCSTCDGPLFKGKRVIMVGGGNSAVTEALYLHNIGAHVTVVHRRDTFRAQEHLTKYLFSANIPVLWNTEVREIRGEDKVREVILYNNVTDESKTMPIDGVFIAIGYIPAVALAKKLRVELTEDGFIKRDEHHRTNLPGVYSAGDVEGGYKQIVTAVGQGAEAALSIYEDLMNPYWLEKRTGSSG